MLNYLTTQTLDDDVWYGFLSHKFQHKTGLDAAAVQRAIAVCEGHADVILFSPAWDQVAYFRNPWEQGEIWHPGVTEATQIFLRAVDIDIDLARSVCDSRSTVYSNYIVAKRPFWLAWTGLARAYFDYVEDTEGEVGAQLTSYGSPQNQYPMRTFVQERFPSLLLAGGDHRVAAYEFGFVAPIFQRLFPADPRTRKLLLACDAMKCRFRDGGDPAYLQMYERLRSDIAFTAPHSAVAD